MKVRILVAAAAAALVVGMMPSPASAADGDGGTSAVNAALTAGSIGSRSVTTVAPITLSSALNASSLSSPYSVLVTEAARTGTNPWSVTAALSDLAKTGAPTTTIGKTNFTISGRSVLQVASGGTSAADSSSENMSAARTLFTNTGQSTTAVYTGTHTASGTLTLAVPNGQESGAYTGTFTVTLVQ